MKKLTSIFLLLFSYKYSSAQWEISSGFAGNQADATGPVFHAGFEWRIKPRWSTKTQVGYKHLTFHDSGANEMTGPNLRYLSLEYTLTTLSWEFHQTLAFQAVCTNNYMLKPNLGLNYRFFHWGGWMPPPSHPALVGAGRGHRVDERGGVGMDSELNKYSVSAYHTHGLGVSLQVQNLFRISRKLWAHFTPFVEPTLDKCQNTGGFYTGVVLNPL